MVPDYVPPPDAPPTYQGCSDRTREGFADPAVYPNIAACAGAWSMPGLRDVLPACDRKSGNDGLNLDGSGCSAADLCEAGWHVCQTKLDVGESMPLGMRSCAGLGASANMFFATAQGGPGGDCSDVTDTDDFQGCGTYGSVAFANCAPLDRTTGNMCTDLLTATNPWVCPVFDDEVHTVTKTKPDTGGGVLCCRQLP